MADLYESFVKIDPSTLEQDLEQLRWPQAERLLDDGNWLASAAMEDSVELSKRHRDATLSLEYERKERRRKERELQVYSALAGRGGVPEWLVHVQAHLRGYLVRQRLRGAKVSAAVFLQVWARFALRANAPGRSRRTLLKARAEHRLALASAESQCQARLRDLQAQHLAEAALLEGKVASAEEDRESAVSAKEKALADSEKVVGELQALEAVLAQRDVQLVSLTEELTQRDGSLEVRWAELKKRGEDLEGLRAELEENRAGLLAKQREQETSLELWEHRVGIKMGQMAQLENRETELEAWEKEMKERDMKLEEREKALVQREKALESQMSLVDEREKVLKGMKERDMKLEEQEKALVQREKALESQVSLVDEREKALGRELQESQAQVECQEHRLQRAQEQLDDATARLQQSDARWEDEAKAKDVAEQLAEKRRIALERSEEELEKVRGQLEQREAQLEQRTAELATSLADMAQEGLRPPDAPTLAAEQTEVDLETSTFLKEAELLAGRVEADMQAAEELEAMETRLAKMNDELTNAHQELHRTRTELEQSARQVKKYEDRWEKLKDSARKKKIQQEMHAGLAEAEARRAKIRTGAAGPVDGSSRDECAPRPHSPTDPL